MGVFYLTSIYYAKIYQMLESAVLGLVQGITEWLPVSSDGAIYVVKNLFFGGGSLEAVIKQALLLHMGTFLAALVYFRKDVLNLTLTLLKPNEASLENKKVLKFLIISTIISGFFGFLLFKGVTEFESHIKIGTKFINIFVAALLFFTAYLQFRKKEAGLKTAADLTLKDSVILGFVQALAALPGLSRSGLTVATLLSRKFDDMVSLRLSFLMSMPIVFFGNLILVGPAQIFSLNSLIGNGVSFVVGLLTIDLLLKLAKRINFGYFAIFFGALLLISIFF